MLKGDPCKNVSNENSYKLLLGILQHIEQPFLQVNIMFVSSLNAPHQSSSDMLVWLIT